MNAPPESSDARQAPLFSRLRYSIALTTAGGRWTAELPSAVRSRLRWFWFDGAFSLGADSIYTTYLALFAVALGASSAQVGALSAFSNLAGALVLLPGALLVERFGRRQRIALLSGGASRITLLLLAMLPFLLQGQAAIYFFLALAALHDGFVNLAYPSWVSLTADIVPTEQRGRYFSSRNIANTMLSMVAAYLAGLIITFRGNPGGYQWAFLIAFLLAAASSLSFSRIHDPAPLPLPRERTADGPMHMLRSVLHNRTFLVFCLAGAFWNLSWNVAAPFFNIYLVKDILATPTQVGLLTAVSSLAGLPALRFFGPLADRWGPRKVVVLTGLLIPILPFSWLLVTSPWHVLPINIASGILWAGYNLAIFNLLLLATPEAERARFSAVYQITILLSLAGGAALGGWVTTVLGYKASFAISGFGRLFAALLFTWFVK